MTCHALCGQGSSKSYPMTGFLSETMIQAWKQDTATKMDSTNFKQVQKLLPTLGWTQTRLKDLFRLSRFWVDKKIEPR